MNYVNAAVCLMLLILFGHPAYAERHCTRTVMTSQGEKTITVECSASFIKDKNPDIIRNPNDLNTKKEAMIDNVNDRLQQAKDRTADRNSTQVTVDQKAADIREKEREAIEAVRLKQQKP